LARFINDCKIKFNIGQAFRGRDADAGGTHNISIAEQFRDKLLRARLKFLTPIV